MSPGAQEERSKPADEPSTAALTKLRRCMGEPVWEWQVAISAKLKHHNCRDKAAVGALHMNDRARSVAGPPSVESPPDLGTHYTLDAVRAHFAETHADQAWLRCIREPA